MQRAINSDIQKLNEHGLNVKQEIVHFLKFIGITSALNSCGIVGACGNPAHLIFLIIFIAAFCNTNIYRSVVKNNKSLIKKDAAYRFLRSTSANWRSFLGVIGAKLSAFFSSLSSQKRIKAIVIDDTSFKKNRSQHVELLAKCHDHAFNTYFKGFRLLNMTWTDGFSTIPLGFSLLSSQSKKNRYNESLKDVDKRSNSYKRREESISGAPKAALNLINFAKSKLDGMFDVVLFDSWFAMPKFISTISKISNAVCMVKKNNALKFGLNERTYFIEGVYRVLKRNSGKAKIIGSTICKMFYRNNDIIDTINVKIVFVRHRITGDWIPILSTNTKWSDEKIVKIYGMRWTIEVFHRDVKQFLRLQTGCQSCDFDSLTAYIAIVYTQYSFISYKKRIKNDDRAFGELFFSCSEEISEISFQEAYINIVNDAIEKIKSMSFSTVDENGQVKCCVEIDHVVEVLHSALARAISIEEAIQSLIYDLKGKCIDLQSELAQQFNAAA